MTGDRVLITGAGGFVAGHLAAGFVAAGHRVTAVDRTFDAAARSRLTGADLLEADLTLSQADLPQAEVMIHGAALTTGAATLGITDAEHVAANMLPLLTMLRHAGQRPPRAFVFFSSSGVFGDRDGSPDLTDADLPAAEGPYSAAKRAGEVLVPGALGSVCATHILRLGYLYGPGEVARPTRARVSMLQDWIAAARRGEPLRVPASDPRRDWTWVPDLAPALVRLLGGPGDARPRHLCAPGPVRDSWLARAIADRVPGTRIEPAPTVLVKAPMLPSRLPALDGFAWTGIERGLDLLCEQEAIT
jgi:nucleoside-diphosphate-sugar epimerase